MGKRLLGAVTWLLVAFSVTILMGGLMGRPVLLAAVPTGSMVPVLKPGDLIPVLPYLGTRLHIGDIVVFRTENDRNWIVHRIVGGDDREGFITRGDANPSADPYRVFRRHVVGKVPSPGGRTLTIPRAGLLSQERGPLSNPAIAVVALAVGLYLVFTDAREGLRALRLGSGPALYRPGPSSRVVLAVYGGLCLLAFLVTFVTLSSLGKRYEAEYRVVASQSTKLQVPGVLTRGTVKTDSVTVRNPSFVPLVMAFDSSDPATVWEPAWVVVGPRQERTVSLHISAQREGRTRVLLRQAVFLPLLPTGLLQALARMSWALPLMVVSLVPALAVLAVASLDVRVRVQLQELRLHWHVLRRM